MRESHPGVARKGFSEDEEDSTQITEQTYYRWRQKYGGMAPEMTKQLKSVEKENARLKKLVAEQALDMEILKEAAKGNW